MVMTYAPYNIVIRIVCIDSLKIKQGKLTQKSQSPYFPPSHVHLPPLSLSVAERMMGLATGTKVVRIYTTRYLGKPGGHCES